MNKKALLSLTLLVMLVANIAAIAVPAQAAVEGAVTISMPDMVVPGGAIEVEITGFAADGGTIYFYLSEDNDPDISSGDIRIAKMDRDDVLDELPDLTLEVPTTVDAGDYYVKVTDSSKTGASCIVSDNTVEVLAEEDWPTITVDPESDSVPTTVDVEGEDINDDWEMETVTLYWEDYEEEIANGVVEDNTEFTVEDVAIPEAFMGKHKILVLLVDEDTVGTYVEFEVEPSITVTAPETYSIDADEEEDQIVTIEAHGFPEGTIDEDSIKYIIKDFETGSTIDTFTSEHDEVDVSDAAGTEGTFTVDTTLWQIDEGVLDIQFAVDGETITLEEQLLSSNTGDVGEFKAKMDKTSGEIGDDVEFMGIEFPADVDVEIIFDGVLTKTVDAGSADGNGAWRFTYTLADLPGGEYTVRVKDDTNSITKNIGTFTVTPSIEVDPDEAVVGDEVDITGEGFPPFSTFDTVMFGSEEVEIDVEVGDDGVFEALDVEIPHISGGGQDVSVKVIGEDMDGDKVTIETTIVINPDMESLEYLDENGDWNPAAGATIFAGNPMKFTGTGFLAGEKVTITFENDVTEEAEITDGGVADSDGDLEVVFTVPTGRKFARAEDWTVTIAGSTDGNEYEADVSTSALDDTEARLFFGLQDDGDLTDEVYVGDSVVVVGVGFDTEDLTLEFGGEEVKDVTASYGYFMTLITIPELQRGTYTLEETETGVESLDVDLKSSVKLSTEKAIVGATVTVNGKGWVEDEDVDVLWPDLPALVSEEPDEDGNWEATFTVPSVPPGTYTIVFDDDLIDEPIEVTFMVLGPLRITSLSMPTDVYVGSVITITVNVMDYFNAPVSGADVTGTVTMPEGAGTEHLTFTEGAPGVYSAEYTVPDWEGSFTVKVTATKAEAGGSTTATGSFYASRKPAPVDLSDIIEKVEDLTDNVNSLTSNVNKLASSVSGLTSDVAGVSSSVSDLSSTVSDLSSSVSSLTSDVSGLTSNVNTLASKVDSLSSSVSDLASGVSDAKAEAASAAATAANLTTLMYIAIIFSLLAFIFAIVSVVQLSRKIA